LTKTFYSLAIFETIFAKKLLTLWVPMWNCGSCCSCCF